MLAEPAVHKARERRYQPPPQPCNFHQYRFPDRIFSLSFSNRPIPALFHACGCKN